MANSQYDLCSQAAALLGEKPIQSFTGGQREATCGLLYGDCVRNLLASYPWSFAQAKQQLARLSTAPLNEWKYAYKLPSDRLGNPNAYYDNAAVGAIPFLAWEVQGDNVLCNEEAVYCDYLFLPTIPKWPPYFVTLVIYALAAVLAVPLTTDQSKAEYWDVKAFGTGQENQRGGQWLAATNADAMGQTNIAIHPDAFTLINVRGS